MIKISFRDKFADLPPALLKKKLEEKALLNITGYNNYTPEILSKLKNMGYEITKDEDGIIWYLNGKRHREDGPAREWADGGKEWYLNGKRHREDGPAREWADGSKEWWLNGKLHREDGPAIERDNGTKAWFLNDKLHREDGPAIERVDGGKSWWLNGKEYSKEEYDKIIKSGNIPND